MRARVRSAGDRSMAASAMARASTIRPDWAISRTASTVRCARSCSDTTAVSKLLMTSLGLS